MRSTPSAYLLAAALVPLSRSAGASGPIEYPDNGSAAFSRAGAWLATADAPIAAHYAPASLATQPSALSVDLNFAFNRVCFERRQPGGRRTGPSPGFSYLEACNEKQDFPRTLPSLAAAWRISHRLGVGFAVVPPATYGSANREWATTSPGVNDFSGTKQPVPAAYRFLQQNDQSTILLPTLSFGVEVAEGLRVGAGFIAGFAIIDAEGMGTIRVTAADTDDHALEDAKSRLRTQDWFVPGAVISAHWSVTRHVDLAVWGRYLDAIETSRGSLDVYTQIYNPTTQAGRPPLSTAQPICQLEARDCGRNFAIRNSFDEDALQHFRFAIPPELRAGVRFHQPRVGSAPSSWDGFEIRDPLHDDVFDVELDGSYTINAAADAMEIRFPVSPDGKGALGVEPGGTISPNADKRTGYKNSVGARLGGQYNAIRDKLGLRVGAWIESESQEAEYLTVSPVAGTRGGFGGGIVLRQSPFDISIGYQRHWNLGLDNGGNGKLRASAGSRSDGTEFNVNSEPRDQQFKTFHVVNGGSVSQSADVFTFGTAIRF